MEAEGLRFAPGAFEFGALEFGDWSLALGVWRLELVLGVWRLEFGACSLVLGVWRLELFDGRGVFPNPRSFCACSKTRATHVASTS